MTEVDYQTLRKKVGRRPRYAPEVSKARRAQQIARSNVAQGRALQALSKAFPDEYRALYHAAKAEVEAERGPLPGDEVAP